jgi:broad specificity phosphatase PhoE
MRLLLFRHAESEANLRSIQTRSGLQSNPVPKGDWGDSALTPEGQSQAQRMGDFWSTILEPAAAQNKLRVFVSPQTRALQTLAPLMIALENVSPSACEASINPDLMETSGLWRAADKKALLEQIMAADPSVGNLHESGTPPGFVDGLMRGRQNSAIAKDLSDNLQFDAGLWAPCGLSVPEIQAQFPWALADRLPQDGQRWFTDGWESPPKRLQRAQRVVDWLNTLRAELDNDTVVVVVAHSDLNRYMQSSCKFTCSLVRVCFCSFSARHARTRALTKSHVLFL